MKAQDAIRYAREIIAEYFSEDGIQNVALEEIRNDEGVWSVTIGFNRSWQMSFANPALGRIYKVVQIRDFDGALIAVVDRDE